tara:strand:- start:2446 stop:2754 length:309 start_codon:yes stop_codon:yes gene_type:complete
MKKINYLLLILFATSACSGLSDAKKVLKNEKISSTDEFLVKKREPLILPPNYEEIPEPGVKNSKEKGNEEVIKKILKAPKTENSQKGNSSTIEDLILDRIRK